MATCPERLGQAPSSVQRRGVFRHPRLANAGANGRFHCLRRVFRWHFPSLLGLASRITGLVLTVNLNHGLRYRRPRGAALFLFRSGQIRCRRPFAFLMVALIVLSFWRGQNLRGHGNRVLFSSTRVKQANTAPA